MLSAMQSFGEGGGIQSLFIICCMTILLLCRDKISSGECTVEDLCYSLQETVFAMLVSITVFQFVIHSYLQCLNHPNIHNFNNRLKLQRGQWLIVDKTKF